MKSRNLIRLLSVVTLSIFIAGCAVPQWFWPQKDIAVAGDREKPESAAVLIASRSSEYKKLLVAELHKQLESEGVPLMIVGVADLKNLDARHYEVVVVINTCLAWGLDRDVHSFLNRQSTTENIILLTTSGDGSWLPTKRRRDFDALSAASVLANVNADAEKLMVRIKSLLKVSDRPYIK